MRESPMLPEDDLFLIGTWVFGLMRNQWFDYGGLHEDERMKRLLLEVYQAHLRDEQLSLKQAGAAMKSPDGRTCRTYVDWAVHQGYLQISGDSKDKRRKLIFMTEKLGQKIEHELGLFCDSVTKLSSSLSIPLTTDRSTGEKMHIRVRAPTRKIP